MLNISTTDENIFFPVDSGDNLNLKYSWTWEWEYSYLILGI